MTIVIVGLEPETAATGPAAAPETPDGVRAEPDHGAQGDPATASVGAHETGGFRSDLVRLEVRSLAFAEVERSVYLWALDRCGGSMRRAARMLEIAKSTFADRCRRMGLTPVAVEVSGE